MTGRWGLCRGGAQMAQCQCSYAGERLLLTGRGMEVRSPISIVR